MPTYPLEVRIKYEAGGFSFNSVVAISGGTFMHSLSGKPLDEGN